MKKTYEFIKKTNEHGTKYYVKILSLGVEVEVSKEVYDTFVDFKTKEQTQERWLRKHVLSMNFQYDEVTMEEYLAVPNLNSLDDIVVQVEFWNELKEFLLKRCDFLELEIFYHIIYCGMTETEFAFEKGIPRTTVNYRKRKLISQIQKKFKK